MLKNYLTLLLLSSAVAGSTSSGTATVAATALPEATAIKLDGAFTETVWEHVPAVSDFRQRDPKDGGAPTFAGLTMVQGNSVTDARFEAEGCVLSIAAASLLYASVQKKTAHEIAALDFDAMSKLLGITVSPGRVACALLPLAALHKLIHEEERKLVTDEELREALMKVIDPEIGINIVDLGLIYEISQSPTAITIQMTLTSMGCPEGPAIIEGIRSQIEKLGTGKKVDVVLVWEPAWNKSRMSAAARYELMLP